jgi:predicted lipoprotein with Yx(FWY)xxD motif
MNFHAIRAARCVATLSAALLVAACASTTSMPAKTADGALTNEAGMTLYTFDRDAVGSGRSACVGPCAANWPAFGTGATTGASTAGDWTVVARDDGSRQWAYKGRPLYTFAKDAKPGDRNGDGFLNGAWHVARP